MNHTLTAPVAGLAAERAAKVRPGLLGGIGGLVFVGAVIAQNAIRSGFPLNDAATEEVMQYYADHRSATIALSVLFPIGLVGLATFLGTVVAACRSRGRARRGPHRCLRCRRRSSPRSRSSPLLDVAIAALHPSWRRRCVRRRRPVGRCTTPCSAS